MVPYATRIGAGLWGCAGVWELCRFVGACWRVGVGGWWICGLSGVRWVRVGRWGVSEHWNKAAASIVFVCFAFGLVRYWVMW